jgi:hypothetical protein
MAMLAHQSAQTVPREAERHYICASGGEFSVRFSGGRAIVLADGKRYELEKRSLSVGIRYGSSSVAFAQDDERAVLVGAPGGPYLDCIEIPPDPVA